MKILYSRLLYFSCFLTFISFCLMPDGFASESATSNEQNGTEYSIKYTNCNTQFYAIQDGYSLSLSAKGEHPTSGYAAWLSYTNIDMVPPEFSLNEKLPFNASLQVISPFEVSLKVLLRDRVDSVVIYDTCGVHKVKVMQFQGY